MPTLLKKISLVFILIFSLFAFRFLSPAPARAEPKEFVKAVQEGNNLQWYLGGRSGMISTTTDSLLVSITGAFDEQGNQISYGAAQVTSKIIASLYNKPVSSVQYLAYVFNHAGLASPVMAQGAGWNFLTSVTAITPSPILKLWEISRNTTYLFFIVIFVAIGFMIMFRSKLNPQTTVNIQLALPKIIISLILVTFSFAICGFIIDFVFLGHNLIQAIFFVPEPLSKILPPGASGYVDAVKKLDFIKTLLMADPDATWGGVDVFNQIALFLFSIPSVLSKAFCLLNPPPPPAVCGNIATNLLPLIFAFTLLGTGLKIFFSLITKYVTLILSTIFSPFVFLFNAFPNSQGGLSNFLKTMLSAALCFPAIAFMFYLSSYFVSKPIGLTLNSLPPLNKIGILAPGGLGGFLNTFEPLIALGLLMATTQIPQAIDQALGVKAGITGAATPEIGGALRKIPLIGSLLG